MNIDENKLLDTVLASKIAAAQTAYEQATGMTIPPLLHNEYILAEWLRCGFKPEDLQITVAYMRREFPNYWQKMVRWPRFLNDAPEFAGYLALARASQRNQLRPRDQRQAVLQATGRPAETPKDSVKRVDAIAKDLSTDYKRLREAAGL